MPLYEYKCERCEQVFEVRQKFADAPLTEHEGCGGSVERLLSAPALQFKGTGFYITDYTKGSRSGSNGSKTASKETKTAPKEAAPSASSDTKADKK